MLVPTTSAISICLVAWSRAQNQGTHPDSGYICLNSIWCIATGSPIPLKMMKRVLVVPWSIAPMKYSCRVFAWLVVNLCTGGLSALIDSCLILGLVVPAPALVRSASGSWLPPRMGMSFEPSIVSMRCEAKCGRRYIGSSLRWKQVDDSV